MMRFLLPNDGDSRDILERWHSLLLAKRYHLESLWSSFLPVLLLFVVAVSLAFVTKINRPQWDLKWKGFTDWTVGDEGTYIIPISWWNLLLEVTVVCWKFPSCNFTIVSKIRPPHFLLLPLFHFHFKSPLVSRHDVCQEIREELQERMLFY